jgi:hypothetical protein
MDNRRAKLTAVFAAVAAVVAVVALIATTYMNIGGAGDATAGDRPANVQGELAPGGPLETGEPNDPTGDGHDVEAATPDATTEQAIQDVTVRFIDAWKTPGTPQQRSKAIGPVATEYLTGLLARVDPRELPTNATVVGDPKLTAFVPYAAGVEVRLSTGERLRVNLVLDTSGWRVSELLPPEPAVPDTPPPTPPPSQDEDEKKSKPADNGAG